MNYTQALEYIHSFTRFGSQLSLNRMRTLLDRIGNPHHKLKFIHIAGTNGKGSTAQMCTNILIDANYKVGTYTSPFVFDFRERFRVNNTMIAKEDFTDIVAFINPHVLALKEEGLNITEFEMITAIGFEFFYRQHCDIVCLEVGLGGKFDATNVINSPLVAIITSISLDHIDILGDTIEKIAGEKAGVIKQNTSVISYPLQDTDAVAVFLEKCAKTNSTFILPNASHMKTLSCDIFGSTFEYQENQYTIKLVGEHQIYNAIAVIEAMQILTQKGFHIEQHNIMQGLSTAVMPARFEIISQNPLIILDGAHNEQAVHSLALNLDKLQDKDKIAIIGMMKDKNYTQAVKEIGSRCKTIITVPVACPRAIDKDTLAETAKTVCDSVFAIEDYVEAIKKAVSLSTTNTAIIICGSFYLAGDFKTALNNWNRLQ